MKNRTIRIGRWALAFGLTTHMTRTGPAFTDIGFSVRRYGK